MRNCGDTVNTGAAETGYAEQVRRIGKGLPPTPKAFLPAFYMSMQKAMPPRWRRMMMDEPTRTLDVPNTQHAIVQTGYGPAAYVLSLLTSYPVTAPSSTQVQIKVHAASLNPIDWQMIEGNRSLIAPRKFPFVPLFDLAGVVTVGQI